LRLLESWVLLPLAGSFIRPIEAGKGDTIQADYGPYGTVSCYFA
jgi:2-oxo-hept-3-ene-1,7-dioate hydratase